MGEVNKIIDNVTRAMGVPEKYLKTEREVQMAKYKKRPVIIEAKELTYNRERQESIAEWCGGKCGPDGSVIINTLEGKMRAVTGDYVIKGVAGEFYPCKPDIFHKTYKEIPNIVFLDIDGVMNSERSMAEANKNGETEKLDMHFHKESVEALRRILKEGEAKIVISSSWRNDMHKVYKAFRMNDLDMDKVIGHTTKSLVTRGKEIEDYLNRHEYNNFVILDDDTDIHLGSFVHIDRQKGLTQEDADKAVGYLNGSS